MKYKHFKQALLFKVDSNINLLIVNRPFCSLYRQVISHHAARIAWLDVSKPYTDYFPCNILLIDFFASAVPTTSAPSALASPR